MGSCPDSTLLLNVHVQVVVVVVEIAIVIGCFLIEWYIIMWWNNQNTSTEQLDM